MTVAELIEALKAREIEDPYLRELYLKRQVTVWVPDIEWEFDIETLEIKGEFPSLFPMIFTNPTNSYPDLYQLPEERTP
jgi:hypothetical protein